MKITKRTALMLSKFLSDHVDYEGAKRELVEFAAKLDDYIIGVDDDCADDCEDECAKSPVRVRYTYPDDLDQEEEEDDEDEEDEDDLDCEEDDAEEDDEEDDEDEGEDEESSEGDLDDDDEDEEEDLQPDCYVSAGVLHELNPIRSDGIAVEFEDTEDDNGTVSLLEDGVYVASTSADGNLVATHLIRKGKELHVLATDGDWYVYDVKRFPSDWIDTLPVNQLVEIT